MELTSGVSLFGGSMETIQPGFEVLTQKLGCCGVLVLRGELDLAGVPAVTAQIEAVANSGSKHLLVDCGGLSFIDSSGLASMVSAHRLFHGNVAMINVGSNAGRLLEMTGLAPMFPAFGTTDRAQSYVHRESEASTLTAEG
jgi:anti-sigma B factor antagonist